MEYQVIVPKKVQKELNKIDPIFKPKIISAFTILAVNPFMGKKLEGRHHGEWSYQAWPYRIIYNIRKHELIILIIHVGHWQGVYR